MDHDQLTNVQTIDKTVEPLHVCEICQKCFPTSRRLSQHRSMKHVKVSASTKQKRLFNEECPTCQKKFLTATTLLAHSMVHTGVRPFSCPVCQRRFAQERNLKLHVATHSQQRSFPCTSCASTFKEAVGLKRHQSQWHSDQPDSQECFLCLRTFPSEELLTRHEIQEHSVSARYWLNCSVCHQQFETRQEVRQHARAEHHVHLRMHKCPHCKRSFRKRATVMAHRLAQSQGKSCVSDDEADLNNADKDGGATTAVKDERKGKAPENHKNVLPKRRTRAKSGNGPAAVVDEVLPKCGCNICGMTFIDTTVSWFQSHRTAHRVSRYECRHCRHRFDRSELEWHDHASDEGAGENDDEDALLSCVRCTEKCQSTVVEHRGIQN